MNNKKSEYNKTYYEKNKQKIIDHLKEKQICEICNRQFAIANISRHNKTKIHIALVEKITNLN